MFDVFYSGPKPNLFAFEQPADSLDAAAAQSRTAFFWYIYGANDYTGFDFSVVPVPWESEHVYVYPSQWQQDAGVYLAHRLHASKRIWNFRKDQQVRRLPDVAHWHIPDNIDPASVDMSWHPDPHAPDFTYHFPSQHQSASGVTYASRQLLPIKMSGDINVRALPTTDNWSVPDSVNPAAIDFSWHPNVLDPDFIYHFPTENITVSELTYTVPGATKIKVMDETPHLVGRITRPSEIFFVDYGNALSEARYAHLKNMWPSVTKVRFANTMWDTVMRCMNRTTTSRFWVISSLNDYTDFDFEWQPEVWQRYMTHVFGSQHQAWSNTFMFNKLEVYRACVWAKDITELPNLNFVTDQKVTVLADDITVIYVDHGNAEAPAQHAELQKRWPGMRSTRFVTSYVSTLMRLLLPVQSGHVWVISSICDYNGFDFSWQPDAYQQNMLHVFPSNDQPFGDTFYIPASEFRQQAVKGLERLDQYDSVNYCAEQVVPRWPMPVVEYRGDDLPTTIRTHQFTAPYTVFTDSDTPTATPNLWEPKTRVVETFTRSGSISIVPRDAGPVIVSQVYDYPYIRKAKGSFLAEQALDVVYISNGEPDAERWYARACELTGHEVKRVQNVNGRSQAYRAAAELSETDWFFAVFAKLELDAGFDWSWQPDRLQMPKHYIFNAQNPVNGMCYGHQGMIAYNRRLTLATMVSGLDFTLSQAHESVPLLSGVAHFNTDAWSTWRTAFREVVKLMYFQATAPTLETEHRLRIWMTVAQGTNAEWCLRGAQDARDFYDSVKGNPTELLKSYEWDWLRERLSQFAGNA